MPEFVDPDDFEQKVKELRDMHLEARRRHPSSRSLYEIAEIRELEDAVRLDRNVTRSDLERMIALERERLYPVSCEALIQMLRESFRALSQFNVKWKPDLHVSRYDEIVEGLDDIRAILEDCFELMYQNGEDA